MAEELSKRQISDQREQPRETSKKFHSVEMKLAALPIYLFKLKDISLSGACFLVKEGSAILRYLEVGQVLNIRYNPENESQPSQIFISEIKHITLATESRYKGHYLIGLEMLEKHDQPDL